jgi:hypothetical protein
MTARIIVRHDDPAFLVPLVAALEDAGYEVQADHDVTASIPPPRATDKLEITISRGGQRYRGLRIRVTGFHAGTPYAGPLGQFLTEPIQIQDVVRAVRSFVQG